MLISPTPKLPKLLLPMTLLLRLPCLKRPPIGPPKTSSWQPMLKISSIRLRTPPPLRCSTAYCRLMILRIRLSSLALLLSSNPSPSGKRLLLPVPQLQQLQQHPQPQSCQSVNRLSRALHPLSLLSRNLLPLLVHLRPRFRLRLRLRLPKLLYHLLRRRFR